MVSEVQRCLTVKTAVRDTHFVSDPLWYIQPMKLVVEERRQTAIELSCVTDHMGGSIEHSLQLVGILLYTFCYFFECQKKISVM